MRSSRLIPERGPSEAHVRLDGAQHCNLPAIADSILQCVLPWQNRESLLPKRVRANGCRVLDLVGPVRTALQKEWPEQFSFQNPYLTAVYSIHSTFILAENPESPINPASSVWFHDCTCRKQRKPKNPMPQEISVSYQAIKSKVYRLIDALVVGEKSEAEVQESIRRWWDLIHPADRPVAQKYLLMVLGRSASALDAVGDGLLSAGGSAEPAYPQMAHTQIPTKRLMDRMVKESGARSAV